MARLSKLLALALALAVVGACGDVPIDDERNDRRLFPPSGVIRGTVTYVGPPPCSRDGHIVGNAIVMVFDRRNPPPPNGFATSAVNFVAVPGDVLFANELRSAGSDLSCPDASGFTIEASAPFAIAPVPAGSYVVSAFYDRRGRFWPTFKFRNLPEAGDVAGGYIDVEDARRNAANLASAPIYRPVDIGFAAEAEPGTIPDYSLGPSGHIADNIPVSIGRVVPFTRPYFHPQGIDAKAKVTSPEEIGESRVTPANALGDPFAVPILTMPQDMHVLAPPSRPTSSALDAYQASFKALKLVWSVARRELGEAIDPAYPFGFQLPELPPAGGGGLLLFTRGTSIPENPAIPALWPRVALVKLASDPERRNDPASLVVQGTQEETRVTGQAPGALVVIEGITLGGDSLAFTMGPGIPLGPSTSALRDHVTALVRPAALCFDPQRVDRGGLLVTPHFDGESADPAEGDKALFDRRALVKAPVRELRRGCLPMGRYAISLVYPSGQSWTVPNESGGCSAGEGAVQSGDGVGTCAVKPRPVLLSQGARAVVEIVGPTDPKVCEEFPVPAECQ